MSRKKEYPNYGEMFQSIDDVKTCTMSIVRDALETIFTIKNIEVEPAQGFEALKVK